MSSRRLLTLVQLLPEDSAFKVEAGEDWPFSKKIAAGILNELRLMRAENVVLAGNEYKEPTLVKSPAQQLADEFSSEHCDNIRSGIMAQLRPKTK